MDGTLIDSMSVWRNGIFEYHREKYGDLCENEKFSEILTPETLNLTTERAVELYKHLTGDTTPTEVVINYILHHVAKGYEQGQPLKKGVLRLLDGLKTQRIKMCVLTATPGDMAKVALEKSGIDSYFDFVISTHDVGMTKRETKVFGYTLDRLGVEPSEYENVYMFEDALYSIRTAVKAGLHTVGIGDAYNVSDFEEMKKVAAECYDTPEDFCNAYNL